MAPRDIRCSSNSNTGPKGKQQQQHQLPIESNHSRDDNDDADEEMQDNANNNIKRKPGQDGWRKRIVQYVMASLDMIESSSSSSPDSLHQKRRTLYYRQGVVGTILTLAVYIAYRRAISKRKKPISMAIMMSLLTSTTDKQSSSSSSSQQTSTELGETSSSTHSNDFMTRRKHHHHQQVWKFVSSLILSTNLFRLLRRPDYATAKEVSLSMLRIAAMDGQVQKAYIGPTKVVFSTRQQQQQGQGVWNRTTLPTIPGIQSTMIDLLSNGGCDDISALPESFASQMVTPLLAALPFVYLAFVYRLLKHMRDGGIDGDGGSSFLSTRLLGTIGGSGNNNRPSAPRTRFSDVAGLDTILPEVQEIVSYLRHPGGYHALGAEPPRGILLHGPPGAGKTLLARAVAGEADCDAFIACSGSDFCELYVGRGASRVRSLFQEARRVARKRHHQTLTSTNRWFASLWPNSSTCGNNGRLNPNRHCDRSDNIQRPATAIIFIDELDALAKNRSHGGILNSNDERDQTLNQLLTEMDGFFEDGLSKKVGGGNDDYDDDDDRVTIIVIGATNRAQVLDPAILRRFDRQIYVPYPDMDGRKAILKIHAFKTRCRFSTVNWDYLAEQTANFSGSDLRQVVNDAALLAVRQKKERVDQSHLIQAIQRAPSWKDQRGNKLQQQQLQATGNQPYYYSSFGPSSSSPLFQLGRNSRQDKEPPLMWLPPEDD